MQAVVYLSLLVAPVVSLLVYLNFRNNGNIDFSKRLVKAWTGGIFAVAFLIIASYISYRSGLSDLRSLKRIVFFSFVTLAASSEIGKFIFLRFYVLRKITDDTPFRIILLSVMTTLGFSTAALGVFIFNLFNIRFHIPVTLYSLVFIPSNLVYAVLIGFFLGMARHLKVHFVYSLSGLISAIFFHGIFTLCILTRDYKLLSLFAFGSTVIVFVLALKAVFTPANDQTSV